MKVLNTTMLSIASALALFSSLPAEARSHHPTAGGPNAMRQQEDDWQKSQREHAQQNVAQTAAMQVRPRVSQYPCGRCSYDHEAGGWVENPHLKR